MGSKEDSQRKQLQEEEENGFWRIGSLGSFFSWDDGTEGMEEKMGETKEEIKEERKKKEERSEKKMEEERKEKEETKAAYWKGEEWEDGKKKEMTGKEDDEREDDLGEWEWRDWEEYDLTGKEGEKKEKEAKNLSRTGFKVKVNRRYRIDDGRIGICRFRGRTAFGKDGEDWIGIMVEHGDGAHNGTVKGKKYFICAAGKGIMVRPQRIVEDLGLPNGQSLPPKMIKGSKSIRKLLQDIAFEKEEEYQRKLKMKKKKKKREKVEEEMYEEEWKPPKFDVKADHGDAFAPKLLHQAHKFKNDVKAERKLKIDEI